MKSKEKTEFQFNPRSGAVYYSVKLREEFVRGGVLNAHLPNSFRTSVVFQIFDELLANEAFGAYQDVVFDIRNELLSAVFSGDLTASSVSFVEKVPYFELCNTLQRERDMAQQDLKEARSQVETAKQLVASLEDELRRASRREEGSTRSVAELEADVSNLRKALQTLEFMKKEEGNDNQRTAVALQKDNLRLHQAVKELEVQGDRLRQQMNDIDALKLTFAEVERVRVSGKHKGERSDVQEALALQIQLHVVANIRTAEYERALLHVDTNAAQRVREQFVGEMKLVRDEIGAIAAHIADLRSRQPHPAAPQPSSSEAPPTAVRPASPSAHDTCGTALNPSIPAPAPDFENDMVWREFRFRGASTPLVPRTISLHELMASMDAMLEFKMGLDDSRPDDLTLSDFQGAFYSFLDAKYVIAEVVLDVAFSIITALLRWEQRLAVVRVLCVCMRGLGHDALFRCVFHWDALIRNTNFAAHDLASPNPSVTPFFTALYPYRRAAEVSAVVSEYAAFRATWVPLETKTRRTQQEIDDDTLCDRRRSMLHFLASRLLDGTELRVAKMAKVLGWKDAHRRGQLNVREFQEEMARIAPPLQQQPALVARFFNTNPGPFGVVQPPPHHVSLATLAQIGAALELWLLLGDAPQACRSLHLHVPTFLEYYERLRKIASSPQFEDEDHILTPSASIGALSDLKASG